MSDKEIKRLSTLAIKQRTKAIKAMANNPVLNKLFNTIK